MTRIVAGALGGRRLAVPAGQSTRPTSDRVREALFSTLGTLLELPGARVLDLYAGSGAVGFEALSRGCGYALFVESDPKAAAVLRRNAAQLGVGGAARIVAGPVARALERPPAQRYDLVFADPPYALPQETLTTVLAAVTADWLAPDGVLVVERSTRTAEPDWPEEITGRRGRRYGETTLWYGRRS
ncbi:DNA methylase [Actinocatenispora thailandica]|uniref:DNA methylase n=1 Tax=Actinocatenispora thailandica TaxID=227318 RepID=A0A7R7HWC7_9ACTN|nr:16S rRNA (guanine(966)-N(2))-methyltransferase RsmD [Actinocatenispora thailandica]BCJ34743.1 DNA methylase [Actinocatenispora thailandica]